MGRLKAITIKEFWALVRDPKARMVQAMEDCILHGTKPVLPLSESRSVVAILDALYESARTGKIVSLS